MKRSFTITILISILSFMAHGQDKLRILFVGNSLTYENDLPAMVKAIGQEDGLRISYKLFLYPDYSLEDHWNEKKVTNEINAQHYDFVIAQQGPSALPESQKLLLEYTGKFAAECKKNKTRLALTMVWPSKARGFDFENVIRSYTQAAMETGSLLCPAGKAWRKVQELDPSLALYSPDNFHPGKSGSFLAAMVIYGSLTGKKDLSFLDPGRVPLRFQVSEQQFRLFCKAVEYSFEK